MLQSVDNDIFLKSKSIFYKNILIWFLVLIIIYCLIPYKTPWLIINLTLSILLKFTPDTWS